MKKLYLLKRLGKDHVGSSIVDYDEYIGFVVCATTPRKALKMVLEEHDPYKDPYTVKLLGKANKGIKEGIILDSFNAG